ncbi:13181_t:CDS:2, partial [Funneliformis caledonium]
MEPLRLPVTLNQPEILQQSEKTQFDQQDFIEQEDFQGFQTQSLLDHHNKAPSFAANTYKHKVSSPLKQKFQLIEPVFSDDESSSDDDENFFSIDLNSNMTLPKSFEKGPLGALPSTDTNAHSISHPITQPNLATKVNTTVSKQNGLFFQDEAHLIQWLKMHKDLILQISTFTDNTPNLAKILSEQSRILFLRTRMPTKRTHISLIKNVVPNMVKINLNWNEVSTKLRQAFENF